jgi:hypothetical protein
VPAQLAAWEPGRPLNLAALVQERGLDALLGGASPREIDAMLRDAYARLGFDLTLRAGY